MNIFNYKIDARKKIIWVHDLPLNLNLDKTTIRYVDKIVVLSNYHKSMLPDFAQDKIYVSTNGINPDDFRDLDNIPRQKNRLIWTSPYNRGLEFLLDIWSDIKKEIPEA